MCIVDQPYCLGVIPSEPKSYGIATTSLYCNFYVDVVLGHSGVTFVSPPWKVQVRLAIENNFAFRSLSNGQIDLRDVSWFSAKTKGGIWIDTVAV